MTSAFLAAGFFPENTHDESEGDSSWLPLLPPPLQVFDISRKRM